MNLKSKVLLFAFLVTLAFLVVTYLSYTSSKKRVICNDKKNEELIYYKLKSKTDKLLNRMVLDFTFIKDSVIAAHTEKVADVAELDTAKHDLFLDFFVFDENFTLLQGNPSHPYLHMFEVIKQNYFEPQVWLSTPIYEESLQNFVGYSVSFDASKKQVYVGVFEYGAYTDLLRPILAMLAQTDSILGLEIFATCNSMHRYDLFKSDTFIPSTSFDDSSQINSEFHAKELPNDQKVIAFSSFTTSFGEKVSISTLALIDKKELKSSLFSLYIDLVISLLAGFAFIIASWIFINKLFLRPLQTLQKAVKNQELVTDKKILNSNDEIALLARNINSSCKMMKDSISRKDRLILQQDLFVKDSIHEIRTPLSIIMLNNGLRDRLYGQDKYSKQILGAVKTLNLVYDDLSFSIEQERNCFEITRINLALILKQRIEFFKSIADASEKSITLTHCEEFFMQMSEKEMYRLIDNNLSNAIKYAYPKTKIAVSLSVNKNGEGVLCFATHSQTIEDSEKIFERYSRENGSKGGHGLGLSIVKSIAQKYAISVKVVSKQNYNEFIYILPKDTDENNAS
jgi:signal transduction histidine kinase